jgi:hypothetical protein
MAGVCGAGGAIPPIDEQAANATVINAASDRFTYNMGTRFPTPGGVYEQPFRPFFKRPPAIDKKRSPLGEKS